MGMMYWGEWQCVSVLLQFCDDCIRMRETFIISSVSVSRGELHCAVNGAGEWWQYL